MRAQLVRTHQIQPSLLMLLQSMVQVVPLFIEKHCWRRAFDSNGFSVDSSTLSKRVRRCLDETMLSAHAEARFPGEPELCQILPRKKSMITVKVIVKSLHGLAGSVARVSPPSRLGRVFRVFPLRRCKAPASPASAPGVSPGGPMFHRSRIPVGRRLFHRLAGRHVPGSVGRAADPREQWLRRLRPRILKSAFLSKPASRAIEATPGSHSWEPWPPGSRAAPAQPPVPPRKRHRASPTSCAKNLKCKPWTHG